MRTQQTPAAKNGNPPTDSLDLKQLLKVLTGLKRGDFSQRMPLEQTGLAGKIADTLNDVMDQSHARVKEFERISRVVGKEGKISQRVSVGTEGGAWTAAVESVNALIGDLVQPSTEVARVIGAV